MSTAKQNEQPCVLIVDDDADSTRVVVRLLERLDIRLLTAASGQEALEILGREPVDVMLLDVMMPGMSGLEVCERVHADPRLSDLQTILLTGLDDFKTRHEGMKLGVSQFMCKPFTRGELIERIEAQIRVARITKDLGNVGDAL